MTSERRETLLTETPWLTPLFSIPGAEGQVNLANDMKVLQGRLIAGKLQRYASKFSLLTN